MVSATNATLEGAPGTGASDVGQTVIVGGRAVWLWGDRFPVDANGGFVAGKQWTRNSAYVQTSGCLVPSRGGAELVPADQASVHFGRPDWYWIYAAKPLTSTTVRIAFEKMHCTADPCGMWDFGHEGWYSADFTLTGNDLTLIAGAATSSPSVVHQTRYDKAGTYPYKGFSTTAVDTTTGRVLVSGLCDNISYAVEPHPGLRLASGKTLFTVAQGVSCAYGLTFHEVSV